MIQTLLFLLTFLLPLHPKDVFAEDVFAKTLLAGAAAVEITPVRSDGTLWQEPITDLNGNKRYDPPRRKQKTTGEPFTDQNNNGKWDGPYLAGFFHNSVISPPTAPLKYIAIPSRPDQRVPPTQKPPCSKACRR